MAKNSGSGRIGLGVVVGLKVVVIGIESFIVLGILFEHMPNKDPPPPPIPSIFNSVYGPSEEIVYIPPSLVPNILFNFISFAQPRFIVIVGIPEFVYIANSST